MTHCEQIFDETYPICKYCCCVCLNNIMQVEWIKFENSEYILKEIALH